MTALAGANGPVAPRERLEKGVGTRIAGAIDRDSAVYIQHGGAGGANHVILREILKYSNAIGLGWTGETDGIEPEKAGGRNAYIMASAVFLRFASQDSGTAARELASPRSERFASTASTIAEKPIPRSLGTSTL
ncbi:hypothetical protein FHL15_011190 [Xylaria flabelliformis]|uniref:Uncharacterized protein n=1 Tax=Xylaria flabelliformis TaxID=2512241 RepID=A0A553HIZ9_9PEZI|nr:hypothetical protein FHL15_011190 [Xylaria flabelliformis]